MTTAFITGITGQDGSYLAELLLEKNYLVVGLVRRSSTSNTERINHLRGHPKLFLREADLCDSNSLRNVFTEFSGSSRIEVYNLAAQSHVHSSFRQPEYTADVDALGPLRILEVIRGLGIENKTRFYQAATSELFGKVAETPQSERTRFHPRSPYAVAKLYAFWIVKNYRESYGMFACNGILFNHESERRGEEFITRKITKGLAQVYSDPNFVLELGNLDSRRDWGYAPEYVEGMWRMLQQNTPNDCVLATGETHTVREFLETAMGCIKHTITWEGHGVDEVGRDETGRVVVKINPTFYRPAEVDLLIGDASYARESLGWIPRTTFQELVSRMVANDCRSIHKTVYVENSGQIQLGQGFGNCISRYANDERFSRYVEIGTWNGRGSTCCFYNGFTKRSSPAILQSYEISKARVREASALWKDAPEIQIIHGRVLQNHESPSYDTVKELFPNANVDWHSEDIQHFWSCPYVPMNQPEVVLLDGAEYLTWFEFEAMKTMPSIRVFMLDDVYTDKCPRIFAYLQNHPDWKLVVKGEDRNGWAVFEKTAVDPRINTYRTLIKNAIQNAELGKSKITPEIINLDGMTGTKTRHFYNNMLLMDDTRYLEIGAWKGSSVCSAMCGNNAKVVCIDNWSEFGGPKTEFIENFNRWKGDNDAIFIEGDCFDIDISKLPKFNIYMYDGNHDYGNHYSALKYYYEHLDDIFIFIVDDWNIKHVRDGTNNAIRDLNLTVLDSTHIRTNQTDEQTAESNGWWNGVYIAILQK